MIVVVCPGQGSQTPGFLVPWLEDPAFAAGLDAMSAASGLDLVKYGTVSDADTIRDTAVAQPLIVAAGILTLRALFADGRRDRVAGIAGHSVGEITAAAGAGILSDADALGFVRERGAAMAEAAALEPSGMSAVLGGDEAELLTTLWCYLDNGRSLEATARELFVHPNTVRYRLKRVSEVIGYDATGAREALILQAALIIGSISDHDGSTRRR